MSISKYFYINKDNNITGDQNDRCEWAMNYYWFITLNPRNPSIDGNIHTNNYMRRSITKPQQGIFFITEIVNGYKHTISDSKNTLPPVTANDQGIPTTIHDIAESIKTRLDMQWRTENAMNADKLRRMKTPKVETEDEGDVYPGEFSRFTRDNPMSMRELQELRKKSPAIKKIKRHIKPCKCKTTKRRK